MPTLEEWGPATWRFFHTAAAKIRAESFPIIGKQLLYLIVQVCHNLPCPECREHATQFMAKMNHSTIKEKQHLKNMLYTFHNIVNRRKHKPPFNYEKLDATYEKLNLIEVYNTFIKYFHTRGNMQMISESFHRNQLLAKLQQWLKINIKHFVVLPSIIHPATTTGVVAPIVAKATEKSDKISFNIFKNLRKMTQNTKEKTIEDAPEPMPDLEQANVKKEPETSVKEDAK